jgi:hypothetical protein
MYVGKFEEKAGKKILTTAPRRLERDSGRQNQTLEKFTPTESTHQIKKQSS